MIAENMYNRNFMVLPGFDTEAVYLCCLKKYVSMDVIEFAGGGLEQSGGQADGDCEVTIEEIERKSRIITEVLAAKRIKLENVLAHPGPQATLFEPVFKSHFRCSAVRNLEYDFSYALNAGPIRVTCEDRIGIEVPNDNPSAVPLHPVLEGEEFRKACEEYELPLAVGRSFDGKVKVLDLAQAPHILMAGATMQGTTECLKALLASLLCAKSPSELKLVLINARDSELQDLSVPCDYFTDLPGALGKGIITTKAGAKKVMESLCTELEKRLAFLEKAGFDSIRQYNDEFNAGRLPVEDGYALLPYIVVVIDEYSDLILPRTLAASRTIEYSIVRLAQCGYVCGIHVILATQRPSRDLVTGLVKSNFPLRIAFKVSTKADSLLVLDAGGAEKLIGRGDMLLSNGGRVERLQGACLAILDEESRQLSL